MSRNALTGVTPGLWRNKRATQTRILVTERALEKEGYMAAGSASAAVAPFRDPLCMDMPLFDWSLALAEPC